MNKTNYIILTACALILIVSTTLLAFVPTLNTQRQFEYIKMQYDINPIFSTNRIEPIQGGWEFVSKGSVQSELVLTHLDILNPVYSIIIDNPDTEYFGNVAYQDVRIIYLERKGINSFEIKSHSRARVDRQSYEKTVELASNYDLSKDFEGKSNYDIINYPPISQDQIDQNRESIEESLSEKEIFQQEQEILESGTPEQKLEIINSEIQRVEGLLRERGQYPGRQGLEDYVADLKRQKIENEDLVNQ